MQSGQRYGLPPDTQPSVGVQTSPNIFGHAQRVLSQSQPRSNILSSREYTQSPQQPLQHPAHIAQSHQQSLPQQYYERHFQQTPTFHQSLNGIPYHQNLTPQTPLQQILQQLRPGLHSPEIQAVFTGRPLLNKSIQNVPGTHNPSQDGIRDNIQRETALNRWPSEQTAALLKICSPMDANMRDGSGFKGAFWEEVSRKPRDIGLQKSAKDCKEKFETAQAYYNEYKDDSSRGQDGTNVRICREPEVNRSVDHNIQDSGISGGSNPGGLGVRTTVKGDGTLVGRRDGCSAPLTDVTFGALDLSGDSSDDEHGRLDDTNEQDRRRKRKRQSRLLRSRIFFGKLTRQIIEQQEALQTKFLESIERRDRERLIRDEAYKMQETARLNREQELRAQELALAATRDAAVISFLEKATGRTLQLPKVIPQEISVSDVQERKAKDAVDFSSKRWPKVEVHALIRLRSGMEPRFQEAGPKAHLWQEISSSLACMGFSRSAKRCKEKWENINKYFKKTKDICKRRHDNAKTCPYFHQLDTLYRKGILASSGNKFINPSETLLQNITENAGFIEDEKAQMLSIFAAREDGSNSCQVHSSSAVNLGSDVDKSTHAAGQTVLEAPQSPSVPDPYNNKPSGLGSQRDGVQCHDEGTSEKSPLRVDTFVKDVLELQRQQNQKLLDEYDRMEQASEVRLLDGQQEQLGSSTQDQSQLSAHNNGALMTLVHRFSGQTSDLAMPAP